MNTIKNSIRLAKIFAFALSVVIFFFPTVAMAKSFDPPCVNLKNGKATVVPPDYTVEPDFTVIKSAVVNTLGNDPNETAMLEDLEIINYTTAVNLGYYDDPETIISYSCDNEEPIKFKKGDDLIKACGNGPARLGNPGDDVQYTAYVDGATPDKNGKFCITLSN